MVLRQIQMRMLAWLRRQVTTARQAASHTSHAGAGWPSLFVPRSYRAMSLPTKFSF